MAACLGSGMERIVMGESKVGERREPLGYVEGETLEVHRFSSEGNAQRHHEIVAQAVRA
jgi:hypothetical protein